jgi:thiopeptide-type bacteriocin biosynthesis protein
VPYADPEPHLRLRIRLRRTTDAAGQALNHLSRWAQQLRDRGLLTALQVDTYQPETGRYGHDEAMTAAERFFTADSRITLMHRQMAAHGAVDADALTAASLTDLAAAFTGDLDAGMAWLAEHLPHQPVLAGRGVHAAAASLADPRGGRAVLRALCGDIVAAAWETRRDALSSYRQQLTRQRDPQTVLPSLLHMHHVRAFGIDPERERLGLHLARTVALRWTATRSHR